MSSRTRPQRPGDQELPACVAQVELERPVGLILNLVGVGLAQLLHDGVELRPGVGCGFAFEIYRPGGREDLDLDDVSFGVVGPEAPPTLVTLESDHSPE